jgi:hypothetical protein
MNVRLDYDRPLIVIEGRLSMPAGPPASHSRPPRRLLRKVAEQIEDKTMRIGVVGGTGTLGGVALAEFARRGHAVGSFPGARPRIRPLALSGGLTRRSGTGRRRRCRT